MEFKLFTHESVVAIHDAVLNPGELTGMTGNKSLAGALSRVDFWLQYGMIDDVFNLAAVYAVAISQARVFKDANKRTAHAVMKLCLKKHGIVITQTTEEISALIIEVAQDKCDEPELARWLREHVA